MKTELSQASMIAGKPIRVRKSKKPFNQDEMSSPPTDGVEGRVITHGDQNGDKPSKAAAIADARLRARTIGEMIAGHGVCYLRHMWDGGRTAFPYHHKLQTVSRYFPMAIGGPLYVDEPRWPHEIEDCRKKQQAMKDMKKRYVLITPEMTVEAAQKELDRWDGQLRAKT